MACSRSRRSSCSGTGARWTSGSERFRAATCGNSSTPASRPPRSRDPRGGRAAMTAVSGDPGPAHPANREALSQALIDHGDRLYSLALRITRDRDLAADAVQEAFATALQRAAGFRGDSSIGTWLHRIVYTKSIDLLRARGREAPLVDEDKAAPGSEDEDRPGGAPTWSRPPD